MKEARPSDSSSDICLFIMIDNVVEMQDQFYFYDSVSPSLMRGLNWYLTKSNIIQVMAVCCLHFL